MVIAMLKVHSISLYQMLRSTRLHTAAGVLSFWTFFFVHFGILCNRSTHYTVFEHFLDISVLCALCSLVERGVRYREMLCAFSIAIIIINSQLKSKQPGNIFTPLGNLHDFFFTSTKEKKSLLLIIISR